MLFPVKLKNIQEKKERKNGDKKHAESVYNINYRAYESVGVLSLQKFGGEFQFSAQVKETVNSDSNT